MLENNDEDIAVSSEVILRFDQRLLTANNFQANDFSLYKLNTGTGYWEDISNLASSAQNTFEAKIKWIDFGTNSFMISKRVVNMCSVKIRVYDKSGFTTRRERKDVSVRAVSIGQLTWTGSQRFFYQFGNCMSLPCDSSRRVYFFTKRWDTVLFPAKSDDVNNGLTTVQEAINYEVINTTWTVFDIDPNNLPQNGPIYMNTGSIFDSSLACDKVNLSENHFKVSRPSYGNYPESISNSLTVIPVNQLNIELDTFSAFPESKSETCSMTDRYLQWYPWSF